MKKVLKKGKRGNKKERLAAYEEMLNQSNTSSRIELIQMLIPLGLQAIEAELQSEVSKIAGARYTRTDPDFKRWGCNEGSVFLGDQKVSVRVPRVRDVLHGKEVPLGSYQGFQNPGSIDEVVFKRLINGISTRKYEKAALEVPATFGIKKSSISRKFIKASARKLKECLERDLSGYDIVSIFIDGKGFAENEIIVALGITLTGEKVILGFIESSTENARVCRDFMNELINRGLNTDNEILFVID